MSGTIEARPIIESQVLGNRIPSTPSSPPASTNAMALRTSEHTYGWIRSLGPSGSGPGGPHSSMPRMSSDSSTSRG